MEKLPYSLDIRLKTFSPDIFDVLVESPYCFFLDSAGARGSEGRYSFFGIDPVRTFASFGGMIALDGHEFIDNPVQALHRFERTVSRLPTDSYLPFSGGLVGFVGHSWPNDVTDEDELCNLPDAWFGLFDTVVTYDHVEGTLWVTSLGLTREGQTSIDLAKERCEKMAERLLTRSQSAKDEYIIKPLTPDPISTFNKDTYMSAVQTVRDQLSTREWQRTNLARCFHAPIATDSWSIHKLLRKNNPTPYASFIRCGSFDILSTSPSCFLRIDGDEVICNVVQRSAGRHLDDIKDRMKVTELLHAHEDEDPAVLGDESALKSVLSRNPRCLPADLRSDARSHYLINQIEGKRRQGVSAIDCLAAAMPGASMTGVPKMPVNEWLRKTEPSRRNIYTGAMGYVATDGKAQFNMAVRTMTIRDQISFVHAGWQVDRETDPEEVYDTSDKNICSLFENIRELGNK